MLTGIKLSGGSGKVADPPGAAPKTVVFKESRVKIPGAKTVKIRYGPYKVSNMGKKNLLGEAGSLYNYPDKEVPRYGKNTCHYIPR
jgi:hypothetical protein